MTTFINKGSPDFYDVRFCNIGKDFIVHSTIKENLSPEGKKPKIEIVDTDKKIKIIAELEFDIESFPQLDKITELVSNNFNIRGTAIMTPKAIKAIEKIETLRDLIYDSKLPLPPLEFSSEPIAKYDRENIKKQQQNEIALVFVGEALLEIKRQLNINHHNDSENIIPPKKDTVNILSALFESYPTYRTAFITELEKRIGPLDSNITNIELAERLFDEKDLISYLVLREEEKQRDIERLRTLEQTTEGTVSVPFSGPITSTREQKLDENDFVRLNDVDSYPELNSSVDDNSNIQFSGERSSTEELDENDSVHYINTEENDSVYLRDMDRRSEFKRAMEDTSDVKFSGERLSSPGELDENDNVRYIDTEELDDDDNKPPEKTSRT